MISSGTYNYYNSFCHPCHPVALANPLRTLIFYVFMYECAFCVQDLIMVFKLIVPFHLNNDFYVLAMELGNGRKSVD